MAINRPLLTPREKQLLRRFARGKTDYSIGQEIGGTERQIAAQRQSLMKKLNITSDAELRAVATEHAPWPDTRKREDVGNRPPP